MASVDAQDEQAAGANAPAPLPRLLYTPAEAASVLGIGRSKLYELLRSGELPSIHIGTARRIEATAVDEYIKARRAAAAALGRLA